MSHKYWVVGLSSILVVVVLSIVGVASWRWNAAYAAPAAETLAAPAQQVIGPAGKYMWNYSVKFVCGVQRRPDPGAQFKGEPTVKPGNYATDINIHNYSYREVPVLKKVLVLVDKNGAVGREPNKVEPRARDVIKLGPDYATMDDCNRIWQLIDPQLQPGPAPLTIGYLVILSPIDLDIDAVYTAEVPENVLSGDVEPTSLSIDVERVPGKRVFVPASELPPNKYPTDSVPNP